jgi:hypothetical protein
VEITNATPDAEIDAWDQVNECTLQVPSGCIIVYGIGDDLTPERRIVVEPGSYRARIYYGNLDSLAAESPEGHERYRIVLWRAAPSGVCVLKQSTRTTQTCVPAAL